MRDRLIELIDNSFEEFIDFANQNPAEKTSTEFIADKILADGWFRPPCKVGQTVYYNCCGKIFKGKCHAITIHDNSIQVHLYDFDGDNASYPARHIYTSREDAEKALRGGDVG